MREKFLQKLLIKSLFLLFLLVGATFAWEKIQDFYGRGNRLYSKRQDTKFIILHTTEAAGIHTIKRIQYHGLANYVVDRDGTIYRTVEKEKVANHAGRSIWEGLRNISRHSVGIEVVGYHHKRITKNQFNALKYLVKELQRIYNVSDDHVLPHSAVAYGRPNRWHPYYHRGRKRCGMLFATDEYRELLDLGPMPTSDPDVESRVLKNADEYLASVLFDNEGSPISVEDDLSDPEQMVITAERSAWYIAREKYNEESTVYIFPDGRQLSGASISDWSAIPHGTRVSFGGPQMEEGFEGFRTIDSNNATAYSVAGNLFASPNTIYFLPKPNRWVRSGAELYNGGDGERYLLNHLPHGTQVLVGYINGGKVTPRRAALRIAGDLWNDPSTFYRYPNGQVYKGHEIDPHRIPTGTFVFFKE